MTDINKQIEEESEMIAREGVENLLSEKNYIDKMKLHSAIKMTYKMGYKSALHSSRWRKVSEDEFPEIDTPILCKFRVGSMQPSIQYRVSTLLKSGRFSGETDWVSVVEWKYIY